jgi:hypothetical protein
MSKINARIIGIFNGVKLTLFVTGPLAMLCCGHYGGWHSIFDALLFFSMIGAISGFFCPEAARKPISHYPGSRTMALVGLVMVVLGVFLVREPRSTDDENVELSDSTQLPSAQPQQTLTDNGPFTKIDIRRWLLRSSGVDDSRYTDVQIEALTSAQLRELTGATPLKQ